MEFRHGPISVVGEGSLVWIFGVAPAGIVEEIALTRAQVVTSDADPMAQSGQGARLAVALAEDRAWTRTRRGI